MFGIGTWELLVILVLGLIILGPTKFPEVAKSIGKGLVSLRKTVDEVKKEVNLDGLKEQIAEEVGMDEIRNSLDVRGEIRAAIEDLDEPEPPPPGETTTKEPPSDGDGNHSG